MLERFNDSLYENLLITQEDFKTIADIRVDGNPTLKTDLPELTRLDSAHKNVEEFYRKTNNGWELRWETGNSSIGGCIDLAETKHLFAEPESLGFYDEDTDEDADIRFFHPFDYPSPESYVGFIIRPDTIYKSVYYMSIGDYELNNLDLDFDGYTQMAIESRVFNHWQVVLLYYMGDINIGSSETETFKAEMPKIFPNWKWENFIAKFESLRISKKN